MDASPETWRWIWLAAAVVLIAGEMAVPGTFILIPFGIEYLQTIAFILVIASLVQLVEMVIQKTSPVLYQSLGIFLPLITTNCAILGLAIFATNKGYGFVEGMVYALGAGLGFTLALVLMADGHLRTCLSDDDTPSLRD